jgi:type IV secretion system protein VirB3
MDQNSTQIDDSEMLVVAMTRPTMIGGFTLSSLVMSFFIPFMIVMITKQLWAGVFIPVALLISYLVCLKDVYLFGIASAASRLRPCVNKRMTGVRRYAPR